MNEFPAARRSTHRCLAQNPLHWREHPTLAPLYNGNISSAVYTQQPMGPWGSATTEGDALASIYHYDQLNRLTGMVTRSGITATANDWNAIPTPTSLKAYASQYSYDANGNILTAQRYDSAGTLYDSLVYFYKKSGAQLAQNRLYHLQDLADPGDTLVNPGAGEEAKDIEYDNSAFVDATPEAVEQDNNYRYDALGNLVKDRREGIDTITWTVAGKVAAVVHASSPDSLKFTYGADGQRTSKTLGDPEQGGYREYYIRDAQGNIMAVYLYKALGTSSTLLLQDRPIYGSKRVGSYGEAEEMLSGPLPPNYAHPMLSALLKYELTDHLGNVRATVSGELIPSANSASMYEPHLLSETDYEPFGSLLPGRNYSSDSYRWGYQGSEKTDEISGSGTHYTTYFRELDVRSVSWWSLDPKASSHPWQSPYLVNGNNPILMVDPNGDKEYKSMKAFAKATGGKSLGSGDWLTSDRKGNTDVWKNANAYNLQQDNGANEYTSIGQRADFYGWFQNSTDAKGFETKWAGAASNVASNIDLLTNGLIKFLGYSNDNAASFAKTGNRMIFEDVFPKLRSLYNGSSLKGSAAYNWDAMALSQEQSLIQPLYESTSEFGLLSGLAKQLFYFSSASSLLSNPVPAFPANGNLMSASERWAYGMHNMGYNKVQISNMPDAGKNYNSYYDYKLQQPIVSPQYIKLRKSGAGGSW